MYMHKIRLKGHSKLRCATVRPPHAKINQYFANALLEIKQKPNTLFKMYTCLNTKKYTEVGELKPKAKAFRHFEVEAV